MNWYEELPTDCPPEKAISPKATYFRLGSIPPDDSDFWSHKKRFPFKKFKVGECMAHSLSIFENQEAAERLKRLLPAMRLKPILQLNLIASDGLIQQTGNDVHHFSWWRSKEFDIEKIKL